jgi:hypothetical protein
MWMGRLEDLARKTCLYPDPAQTIARGTKLYTLTHLREIAKTVTHTDYPEIVVIPDPSKKEFLNRKNLVMKRSFSDTGKHVLLRPSDRKGGPAAMQKSAREIAKWYDHQDLRDWGVIPTWFGQPFVQQLLKKGEVRCFFLGGVLRYMLATEPVRTDLQISEAGEFTPLSYLS